MKDMKNILNTDIYAITSEAHSLGRSNIEVAYDIIKSGVKVIQYREKDKHAREMYLECLKIREMTQANGVTFIINDHIDIAMLVGADGVHIGQDDLPAVDVRKLVGKDMIIGLSTHSPEQANNAIRSGVVDYIGVGPIYTTETKTDVCKPVGIEYLKYVVDNLKIPFVAIGGIKEHNINEVKDAGAKLICLVTEIVGSRDIKRKIENLRATIQR